MAKGIKLTREECCVDLAEFYGIVASKIGLSDSDIKKVLYNCREIYVTVAVQDEIIRHYYEQGWSAEQLGMFLVGFGPKALLVGDGYFARVEDGFIVRKEI